MKKQQNLYHFLDTFCYRISFFTLTFYFELLQRLYFEFCDLEKIWNQEAFYFGSPYLFFEQQKLIEKNDLENFDRLKLPFLKYIIQASTYCTPFRLFSGIALLSSQQHKRNTLLDLYFLFNLSEIITETNKEKTPIAQQLSSQLNTENITQENLLSSYIHMTINRLFRDQQRLHELVCYSSLYRFYQFCKNTHAT